MYVVAVRIYKKYQKRNYCLKSQPEKTVLRVQRHCLTFIHSLVHSFNIYTLNALGVSGTFLGMKDTPRSLYSVYRVYTEVG